METSEVIAYIVLAAIMVCFFVALGARISCMMAPTVGQALSRWSRSCPNSRNGTSMAEGS
jgi:hypothetical protein